MANVTNQSLTPSPHTPQSQLLSIYQHISGPDELSLLRYSSLLCSGKMGPFRVLASVQRLLPTSTELHWARTRPLVHFLISGLFAVTILTAYSQGALNHPASLHIRGLHPSERNLRPKMLDTAVMVKSKGKVNGRKLNAGKGNSN